MAYLKMKGMEIRKKKRELLSTFLGVVTLIALVISTGFNVYYAWRSDNLQHSIDSLTYFQPFIYSINSTSTLNPMNLRSNDTVAVLYGNVTIDLKVVTPYDGMLEINVENLNLTHTYEVNLELDMNYLNFTEHSVSYMGEPTPQYFISKNVINSIEDKLLVELTVILKPNWLSPPNLGIGFDLGNITFNASLSAVQTTQTINQTFFEDVFGNFTPTS